MGAFPGGAETTSSTVDVDELEAERDRVAAAETANAAELDAANADLSEVNDALRTLQEKVDVQAARVVYANERLAAAEQAVTITAEEVAEAEADLAEMEERLAAQAVEGFMGGNDGAVVLEGDPNEAIRRQELLASATQTDRDLISDLRAAREDLEVRQAEANGAVADAEAFRVDAQAQLDELGADQAAQQDALAGAEARLDHLLSERQALATLGEELETDLEEQAELARQLAAAGPPPPPPEEEEEPAADPDESNDDDGDPEPAPDPGPVNRPESGSGNIVYVGNGIEVDASIADQITRLLADSAAAGVELAGGGYRSPESQIAVRRNNCGTSSYAIYEMPASQCRPPTAIPGRSMHEQGLAIDFTCSGSLIRSRSGSCWNWLAANAAAYGLQNLPSEPWHWSTNGR